MPHQPNLFSPEPGASPPEPPGLDPRRPSDLAPASRLRMRRIAGRQPNGPNAWLQRTELLVRVIVRLYLGLLIIVLPWMRFWTENGLFTYTRGIALVAGSGFVRGMVSGLGLLNVILAFRDLVFPDRGP